MRIPEAIVEGIETLLAPYQINFKEMLQRNQSASSEELVGDEWMTLKAAALFSGVSIWTVRRWCRKGVASRKTSRARCGRIIINKNSLMRFLENLPD